MSEDSWCKDPQIESGRMSEDAWCWLVSMKVLIDGVDCYFHDDVIDRHEEE